MLMGNESLENLYKKESDLKSEIEKLHGAERKEKESYLQDVRVAIEKLKGKAKNDDVKY
jgi:hypothetical protein